MPLGELKLREVSPAESRQWRYLKTLKYPEDIRSIRHLSGDAFRKLLYAMDPRVALLMSDHRDFREVMEYQAGKKWYHEVRDLLWRILHGAF